MSSIGGLGGGLSQSWRLGHQPPSFDQLDKNSDGNLTLDEFKSAAPGGPDNSAAQKRAERLFAKIDSNGDDSISSDEKAAFDQKISERRQALNFLAQSLAGGQEPQTNDAVFNATDSNADGSVDLAEFSDDPAAKSASADQLQKLFSLIDTNGDGSISKDESSSFLDAVKSAVADRLGSHRHHHQHPQKAAGDVSPVAQTTPATEPPAPGLFNIAQSAYNATSQRANLLATLTSIFESAA